MPRERAFAFFVEHMEAWWPAAHHIAAQPFQTIFVEPRAGGRWYERDAQGSECEWGTVLAWEPPRQVTFSWHLGPDWKFNPDLAAASEVEIRFTPDGPAATLRLVRHPASSLFGHAEWARFSSGHQARRAG